MSLVEVQECIDAYTERRKEEFEEYLFGIRQLGYYTLAPQSNKIKRPQDLFELEVDREIRRNRVKGLKPIQKIVINNAE